MRRQNGGTRQRPTLIRCDSRQVAFLPFSCRSPSDGRKKTGHEWLFYQLLTTQDMHQACSHLSHRKHRQSSAERHSAQHFQVCHFCLPVKPLSPRLREQGIGEKWACTLPNQRPYALIFLALNSSHCVKWCNNKEKMQFVCFEEHFPFSIKW